MRQSLKFRTRFCLIVTTSLVLVGCSGEQKQHAAGSPEALLEAEGEWALVEEKQAPSPEQKHMNSRQQVNPAMVESSGAYTEKVSESEANDDVHFRVLRLERQMNALQGNFDKMLPPLGMKANADRELNRAVEEIQASKMAEASAPMPPKVERIEPYPDLQPKKKEPVKQAAMPKPVTGGALQVSGIRVGEHPGKTRLVLDVTGPSKFTADVDTAENLMVVELPGAGWGAATNKSFGNSPLLKGYSVQPSGDGSRLVLELKKPAKLTMKSALPPNEQYGHRIVFDLATN
jgi:hypothetical protein